MKSFATRSSSDVGTQIGSFRRVIPSACLLAFLLVSSFADDPSSQVSSYTIDGGGGTVTGGVFQVTGIIGQPDAADTLANGAYSLTGGFWTVHALQSPGAPRLTIAASGPASVTLSWSPDAPGWLLQELTDLASTNWINSATGSTNPVTLTVSDPVTFYRLYRP
jgi:hypothetical protein